MRYTYLIHTLTFIAPITFFGPAYADVSLEHKTPPVVIEESATTSISPKDEIAKEAIELKPDPQTTASLPKKEKRKSKTERLNALFVELKREPNERKAKQLASRIAINWSISGSHTADALMVWAQQAIREGRHKSALEMLDQVIVLEPNFAEVWNRRATLHFIMRNHAKSMADIERTLELEPRHFGALSGMASILAARGKDEDALEIYEHVLAIYPAHQPAQKGVLDILEKLEKSEI